MKKVVFLSLMILISVKVFSQIRPMYSSGDTVVGKNVKYLCKSRVGFPNYIDIENINNKDTTLNIYYTDGTLMEEEEEILAVYNFRAVDVYSAIELVFTSSELELLRNNRVFIAIHFTTDSEGKATEISFGFFNNAKVLSTFDPDRFYELENKLKGIIGLDIDESQKVRNPKGTYDVFFKDIP
jgi:hypothetical protein